MLRCAFMEIRCVLNAATINWCIDFNGLLTENKDGCQTDETFEKNSNQFRNDQASLYTEDPNGS